MCITTRVVYIAPVVDAHGVLKSLQTYYGQRYTADTILNKSPGGMMAKTNTKTNTKTTGAMLPTVVTFFCGVALCSAAWAGFEMPKRKSGLWEMTITTVSKGTPLPPTVMQMCIDEKTDDLMRQQGAGDAQKMCSKNEVSKQGNSLVIDSVCQFGQTVATSRAVMTGSFDSAYTMESHSTFNPPMMGMTESTTRMQGKWLSACQAGQKPGDVIMPSMKNMPKMNMNELMKMKH